MLGLTAGARCGTACFHGSTGQQAVHCAPAIGRLWPNPLTGVRVLLSCCCIVPLSNVAAALISGFVLPMTLLARPGPIPLSNVPLGPLG